MPLTIAQRPGKGRSASKDADRRRVYARYFEVTSDDPTDDPAEVLAFVEEEVGAIGSGYYAYPTPGADPLDAGAFLRSIRIQEEADDGCTWAVECEWGPWEPGEASPLDEPPEVSIDWQPRERVAELAWEEDGGTWGQTAPITNSAGDVFDPPVVRDDSRLVLRVSLNEPAYPLALAFRVRDTVNAAAVSIASTRVVNGQVVSEQVTLDAKTLKAAAPKARRMWSPDVVGGYYWRTDYEFEVNNDGWTHRQLDNGFRYLEVTGTDPDFVYKLKVATLDDGSPPSSPVLLDGSGGRLEANGTPVALEFDVYEPVDFPAVFGFFSPVPES